MNTSLALRLIARTIALIEVVLGLLFWTGQANSLVIVHIVLGLILVLDLWAAAAFALRSGGSVPLAAVAFLWGLAMTVFGLLQARVLSGSDHFLIQIVHLAVGLAAVGLVEVLARAPRSRATI